MKQSKLLLVLILFTMGGTRMAAQVSSIHEWKYVFFEEWQTEGDTIYGKKGNDFTHYYYVEDTPYLNINGRDYHVAYHMGELHEMDSRSEVAPPRDRKWYSIGIRMENGRVYVDREDFEFYQGWHLVDSISLAWLVSYGNPDYMPYHFSADSTELILYDYTMEVGDRYRHVDGYDDIVVVKKDIVVVSGDSLERRRLTLSNGMIVIEGIGCINSNGMLFDYLNPEAKYASRYTYLSTCKGKDGYVYFDSVKDSGLHIVDMSTLGVEEKVHTSKISYSPVYDLQGRRLKGEPKRGLYIKDGKKVVKR